MNRLLITLAACCSMSASAQAPLRAHEAVSDSLGVHDEHAYSLRLDAGDVAVGDADGPEVDMVVRVVRPDGTELESFDTGARGPEPFEFTADTTGVFQIVALPFQEETGRYTLTLYRSGPPATDALGRVAEALAPLGGDGPGGVFVLIRNGEIAETIARGTGAHNEPAGLDTRYDVGRVAESMTAAAAYTLARNGRLDLGAPVQTYLPGLPAPTGTVTVQDLIDHTTGFLDVAVLARLRDPVLGGTLRQSAAAEALRYQSTFADSTEATREGGGQTDYMLLALVIEAATGEAFGDWMRASVFEPLGMMRTTIRTAPGQSILGVPVGYDADGSWAVDTSHDGTYGWGNVYTTPADFVRWMAAVTGGRPDVVVPWEAPEMEDAWWDSMTKDGLGVSRLQDGFRIATASYSRGFQSVVLYDPATRSGYALLANTTRDLPVATRGLLEFVFPDQQALQIPVSPPSPPPPLPPSPDQRRALFESLSGRYTNADLGSTYTVGIQEDRWRPLLTVTDQSGETIPLRDAYQGGGRPHLFYSYSVLGQVEFEPAAPARAEAFVLRGAGREGIRFTRLAD